MKIPITKPFFDENERKTICDSLEGGWVVQGPKVKEFEELVSKYTGAKFAKATTSCTTALHLALLACNVKSGDEVILPAFTFIASANVVEHIGAKPVFVDIDLKTYNIDVNQIEKAITKKTKVIMPVHLFGLCADMEAILKIAGKYDLKIVEDAACGIGSFYKGQHSGTFGDAGCFSFHPRKSITTGEGGMVITNNVELAEHISILRDHGASIPDWQRHMGKGSLLPEYNVVGYNYRLTDIQGGIGVEQMKKLDWILERRRELATRYDEYLREIKWLKPPFVPSDYVHGYQSYVCLFSSSKIKGVDEVNQLQQDRNKLMAKLESQGVAARQGTHAVHLLGYYKNKYNLRPEDYFNAFVADRLTITLPLYPQMSDEEQRYVIEQLKSFQGER